jgi:ClpP class serine protease
MKRRALFVPEGQLLAIHASALAASFTTHDDTKSPFLKMGDAAVVDIRGPLVQHSGGLWLSYEEVTASVKAAAASPCMGVVLRIDSPGGDALGVGECARELRAICQASQKPLLAFVDGMTCSAAYALACSAQVIVTPPAGLVGSVGTYQPLVDATVADALQGRKYTMVSSGARKLDGNPHTVTSAGAVTEAQRRVDELAHLFFELVEEMRPVASVKKLEDLEGAAFLGKEAVASGLADMVGSFHEVLGMVSGATQATASAKVMESKMAEEKKAGSKAEIRKALVAAITAAVASAFPEDDDEKKDDDKKDEPAKKDEEKSESEPDKKDEEKSESEGDKKDEDKKDSPAAKSQVVQLASELHSLKASIAKEREDTERAKLLASRPDFSSSVRKTLASVSLAELKSACETWEHAPYNPAAAANVTGTQGNRKDVDNCPPKVAAMMDEAMGLKAQGGEAMTREAHGFSTVFNPITPERARAIIASKNGKAV